jgi:exodeoxyribonuclease VII large subunit
MRVVVGGRVTVYMARGNYQLDCAYVRPDGVGELYKAFEKLKAELQARGWFDEDRKRDLPRFPQRVGIATSKTGAALHDMLTTIERRYRAMDVVVRPTLVQGDGSAEDVAAAIGELNGALVDVIIVGRGGGSIEDLWSFNTEVVARAIVESATPVISAVGHETDVTIADFVADRRAPTPTAAAVYVTPFTTDELMQKIDDLEQWLSDTMLERVESLADLVDTFVRGTALGRIQERLDHHILRVDQQEKRQPATLLRFLDSKLALTDHTERRLTALHPYRPLRLGFAIIERNRSPLLANELLRAGETVRVVRWQDEAEATITEVDHVNRETSDG